MRGSRLPGLGVAFILAAIASCLTTALADDAPQAADPRALLDKLLATEMAAKTFQMSADWNMEMSFLGQQMAMSLHTEIAYQQPNLFRARFAETEADENGKPKPGGTLLAVCDGKQFFVDATHDSQRTIVAAPAPPDLLKVKLNDMVGMGKGGDDTPEGEVAMPDFLSVHDGTFSLDKVKSVTAGYNHDDAWLKTLKEPEGCVSMTVQLAGGPPYVVWIDPRDCSLRQIALSVSGADQAAAQPKAEDGQGDAQGLADLLKTMSMHMVITADKVVYDAEIPAADFAYEPPAGAKVIAVKSVDDIPNALEPPKVEEQGGAGAPGARHGTAPKPHPDTAAWRMLEQMVATYRSAKTYVEQGTIVLATTEDGKPSRRQMPYKIVYQAPNRLWARGGGADMPHVVACDGASVYLQRAPFEKVAKGPAPTKLLDNENLWEAFSTPDLPCAGPDFIDCLAGGFGADDVKDVREGLPPGQAWYATLPKPKGTASITVTMNEGRGPAQVVVWIDSRSHVARQWALVVSSGADSMHWTATATRVVLNQPVPPEVFVYRVPKDTEVVDAEGLGGMMRAIVGNTEGDGEPEK